MTRAPHLGISVQREHGDTNVSPLSSPRTPHTPGPHSPFQQSFAEGYDLHPHSPITAVPRAPSPKPKSSKSFFSNAKASRSTTKIAKSESPSRRAKGTASPANAGASQVYPTGRSLGSSPELSVTSEQPNLENAAPSIPSHKEAEHSNDHGNASAYGGATEPANAPKKKQSKHKFGILGRKSSVKDDNHHDEKNMAVRSRPLKSSSDRSEKNEKQKQSREPLDRKERFAPEQSRDRSMDRGSPEEDEPSQAQYIAGPSAQSLPAQGLPVQGLSAQSHHTSIHTNLRSTSTRAADGLGRAAKGLLGKFSARGNPSEREAKEIAARSAREAALFQEEAQKAFMTKSYQIVTQTLDVQTRTTRICKRLEDCKDKTEFWLPAVAYRCIDYLNDRGMAHEGLYRIPGSEREVRNWLYRFDKFHDIDLLNEAELYDVNIISSMFKCWLRDLPEEIFPQSVQDLIVEKVGEQGAKGGAPALLKEQLSKLPPFNYYLLFAVTAHITMLLNASNENKMTFNNLCVCFMPCLRVNHSCFSWLILDWKNCWDGCHTEREYLEREYAIQDGRDPNEKRDGSLPEQHFDRYPPPFTRTNRSEDSEKASAKPSTPNGPEPEKGSRSKEPGRGTENTFPTFEFSSPQTDFALSFDPPESSQGPNQKTADRSKRSEASSTTNDENQARRQGSNSISSQSRNQHHRAPQQQHAPSGSQFSLGPIAPTSPFGTLGNG